MLLSKFNIKFILKDLSSNTEWTFCVFLNPIFLNFYHNKLQKYEGKAAPPAR